MAVNTVNKGVSGVVLPAELARQVWSDALEESAVARLASPITLPGNGLTVPLLTGDVSADWVAEGAPKPTSTPTFGNKTITGYKMAVIVPVSEEFRRDADNLYAELVRRIPAALAAKLDSTVLGGTAPGTGFDVLSSATAVGVTPAASPANAAEGFLDAIDAVEAANGVVTGWAIAPQAKALLRRAVDADRRPLFMDSYAQDSVPTLLGAPTYVNRNVYKAGPPNQLGYTGEFTNNLFLGYVEGIRMDISDQATLENGSAPISLWQRNLFAIRCEMTVGVAVRDLTKIRKLTDTVAS